MKNLIKKIFKPRVKYQPLIEVRVFKDSLLHNLKQFQSTYPNLQIAPVLKSNAYGHGLWQVAQVFDKQGCPFFVADSFYEALTLRQNGIQTKILILGYVRPKELLEEKIKNVSACIISLGQLKFISENLKKPKNFHLKLDTGMHRQGVLISEVGEAIGLIKKNQNIILEGVCSHFADADGESSGFTNQQITEWNKAGKIFKQNFPTIKYFHLSNTAGTYFKAGNANVARVGIGLYGINASLVSFRGSQTTEESLKLNNRQALRDASPSVALGVGMTPRSSQILDLKPALEMRSVISGIKTISVGEKVGYGITFEAKQTMKIATVPVGYYEGIDRRLSNIGFVKIGQTFCPIIGRVSMNISSIDVSGAGDVQLGQEVVVISNKKEDKNSVENIAKLCGCIPYEILVHIPSNLRRIIK